MRIILLGTGTPVLNSMRQQSALLVDLKGEILLFDAGTGVSLQMVKAGFQPEQIDAVFITHHHYDHISGLGEFLLTAWHNGRERPLTIYGPQGTAEIIDALLGKVYAREIAFTMFTAADTINIRDLVKVMEVPSGWACDSTNWKAKAETVDHGNSLGLSQMEWPCLGYRLEAEGKVIVISGDTAACQGLDRLALGADVLIQCCYLAESEITSPASQRQAKYIIASSGQVGQIAVRNNVKKLVLTHIRPKSNALMASMMEDARKDFSGELLLGEDLMVIDV